MHLKDEHIAWMHKFGITSMRFDPEGNVLDITVLPWVSRTVDGVGGTDMLLAKPEAPVPPPLKELTAEEARIAIAKMRRQAQVDAERALYAAVGGPPWTTDDEPRGPHG
jgi:hypothetical protein